MQKARFGAHRHCPLRSSGFPPLYSLQAVDSKSKQLVHLLLDDHCFKVVKAHLRVDAKVALFFGATKAPLARARIGDSVGCDWQSAMTVDAQRLMRDMPLLNEKFLNFVSRHHIKPAPAYQLPGAPSGYNDASRSHVDEGDGVHRPGLYLLSDGHD